MEADAPHAAKKILIVDDEGQFVMMLRNQLELEGYETDQAFSGNEALEKIMKEQWDLLLLDYLLPDTLAPVICRRIREDERLNKLPILIITAVSSRGAHSFKEEGATDVIYKPIHVEELIAKIKACLNL